VARSTRRGCTSRSDTHKHAQLREIADSDAEVAGEKVAQEGRLGVVSGQDRGIPNVSGEDARQHCGPTLGREVCTLRPFVQYTASVGQLRM
jgi:hypothetical protein